MVNFKKIGFGFINIFIYIFITELLTYILGKFRFTQNIWVLNIYLLLAPIVVGIILVSMNKDLFKDKFQDIKEHKKEYLQLGIKYYIYGLLLMMLSSIILSFVTEGLPQNEEGNRALLKTLPIYSFISMVITAPLSEEIAFRGSFKNFTNNKTLYLIVTSFLFGFIHVAFSGDYINILPYAALGFFLSKAYYETDNILVSTIIHSFHNFLCILLIIFGGAI